MKKDNQISSAGSGWKSIGCSLLLGVITLVCLTACSEDAWRGGTFPAEDVSLTLSCCTQEQVTKSSGEALYEESVRDVNYFVFNHDSGMLDASLATGSAPVTFNVSRGCKDIYAVVNHGSDISGQYPTKASLMEAVNASLCRPQADTSLGMSGMRTIELLSTKENVSIAVDRVVSKVVVSKITNCLNPSLGALTIKGIYLSNVAADVFYFKDAAPSQWVNRRGRDLLPYPFLSEKPLNLSVPNGRSHDQAHCFYCCPNPTTADSQADQWCARHTRLVLEAEVGGKTVYYPVSINSHIPSGKLKRNTCYTVRELKITHIGTSDPDIPSSNDDVSFTVEVNPWDEVEISPVSI